MKTLTTTSGNVVADNQNSITAGKNGPLLMQDYKLIEKLALTKTEKESLKEPSMQKVAGLMEN